MSSKSEPSQFDAYSKAETDEPSFTLLGRDPIAPSLIEAWAYLRSGQIGAAEIAFNLNQIKAHAREKKLAH